MKKKMVLVWLILLLSSASGWAADSYTNADYFRDIGIKLGRGLFNIVQSPAEIPCTMTAETKESGALGLVTGLGKGLWKMVYRIWVGVDEAGTFVIPMEPTLPPVCQSTPKPQPGVS